MQRTFAKFIASKGLACAAAAAAGLALTFAAAIWQSPVQAQELTWGAIAVDGKGSWGWAHGGNNKAGAANTAVSGCGAPGCRAVMVVRAKCIAFADSRSGGYWYGHAFGPTNGAVTNAARSFCHEAGAPSGSCRIRHVTCF
ncbi:MAG: DUF4189 domain-containing protein [Hyphomicrobiaceae bacterium]